MKKKFNLEHHSERVVTFPRFILRLIRFALFSFLLIFVSVAIGVAGYRYFGNVSWLDSFHMACMILTGMGPVVEMKSDSAKLFSSFYALYSGVAFLSTTAVFFAPIIHRLMHILHVETKE